MCGIGGIYCPLGVTFNNEHREALDRIESAIELRGPDAGATVTGEQYGLVHRRLSIIDPDPRSNQPMESEDWILSYNGEIYNFQSIRNDLAPRHEFQTSSDTEVLLVALQLLGFDETLRRVAGMFAFLAYNKRENILYAARDHMGIKPLLMTRLDDGSFAFASSVTALVDAVPKREWQDYKPALASYFILGAPFTRSSVVKGIERVEPATYVKCLPDGTFTKHKFWEPSYQEGFTMDDLISIVGEYGISDVNSALFLSGGVDSTFLAATTRNLDAFHLVSPETEYARHVATTFGRKFISVEPELEDFEEDVRKVIEFHGEPLMSCGIPYSVSKEVARHSYKMAISANGADELFHGYPRTPSPGYTPAYLPLHETKTHRWFSDQLAHIFRDDRNFVIEEYGEYIPSLIDIGNDLLSRHYLSDFPASASHRWMELMTYVLHDLNPTLDAASMANSIEVRVPFLDHRVVEGVLSWDAEKLITPALGRKAPLKEHLSAQFPMSFFHRPKLGFSIHEEKLGSISDLGKNALRSAMDSGFLTMKPDSRFGEFERDMIYLGSTCFSHDKWKQTKLLTRGLQ